MKSFRTLDLLGQAIQFHAQLSGLYAAMSAKAQTQEGGLLLNHMSRREERLKHDIEEYRRLAPKKVLKSWHRAVPDCPTVQSVEHIESEYSIGK